MRKRKGKNLSVVVSEGVGFCSGVTRAIKIALAAAGRSPTGIYTLGPLIHNPQVVNKLKEVGVKPLGKMTKGGGLVVLRSHGVSRDVLARVERYGYTVIDATCPFVRKAQEHASNLYENGYKVVIVGEKRHPEVKAIQSHVGGDAITVENVEQAKRLKFGTRVGIIAQTTSSGDTFGAIVSEVAKRSREVLAFNTICSDTARRQEKARALAAHVDVMLVVGGRNSANTSRLASLCRSICARTHHVETADEIDGRWFKRGSSVGIVAGASTPTWLVEDIVERLETL